MPPKTMSPDDARALCASTPACAAFAMSAPGPAPSTAAFKSAVFWQPAAQGNPCSSSACVYVKNRGYETSAPTGLWSASLKGRGLASIPSLRVRGDRFVIMSNALCSDEIAAAEISNSLPMYQGRAR